MVRGRGARAGPVAWNQRAGDGWVFCGGTWNTEPPFLGVERALAVWAFGDWRARRGRLAALLAEVERLDGKRDWREVSEGFVSQMEAIARELYGYAKWDLSGGKEGTASPAVLEWARESGREPRAWLDRGLKAARAFAEVSKCAIVARVRIAETMTAAGRSAVEASRIAAAVDPAEGRRRAEEWARRNLGLPPGAATKTPDDGRT